MLLGWSTPVPLKPSCSGLAQVGPNVVKDIGWIVSVPILCSMKLWKLRMSIRPWDKLETHMFDTHTK
jgi:hypothetical protein